MEDYKNLELLDIIDKVNPYQKVIHYFIAGFIFAGFYIDYSFLSIVNSIVSALCFYLGLRMIKNENKPFLWAYSLGYFFLFGALLEMIIFVTPFQIPLYISLFFLGIKMIVVLLICAGLHLLIDNEDYPIKLGVYYVVMNLIIVFSQWFIFKGIILYILLFVLMIKQLINCKQDLINHHYQISLSHVKYPAIIITMFYIIVVVISMIVSNIVYPHMIYKYVDGELINYKYPLLDEKTYQNLHVQIYDYDKEHYLTVYRYTFDDVKIKTIKFSITHTISRHGYYPYQIVDLVFSDTQNCYEIRPVETIKSDNPFFMPITNEQFEYEVFLDPQVDTYILQFGILMDKAVNGELLGLREDIIYFDIADYTLFPSAFKNTYHHSMYKRCIMSDDIIEVIDE